jgi:Zn-dependent M32 family carboxypeptidase
MCAVQIFDAARRDLPDLDADLAAGRFAPLKGWLNRRVHAVGSLYATADELMEAVTGAPLRPEIFLKYIKAKYTELYQL